MKATNIILGIILFFSFETRAQNLMLRDSSGNSINNGDTIVVAGTTDDFILAAEVHIFNPAAVAKSLLVEKTNLYLVPGTESAFAFGVQMYSPFVFLSVDTVLIPAAGTDSSFRGWDFTHNIAGTSFVRYNFFDANNTADHSWVVIEYNVQQAAGIEEADSKATFSVYPNPGNGVFNFSASGNLKNNLTAEIFTAQGKLVQRKYFSSFTASAVIDLSGEEEGIYFLQFRCENGIIKRIKLMHTR